MLSFRAVATALVALQLMLVPALGAPARAQSDPEKEAARRLFVEAVDDEDEKRFDAALAKFRKVQQYRDTLNVRYRIGTCLEALGQLSAALLSFEKAVQLGATEPASGDVLKAATERVAALDKRVARLALRLSERAPPDADVRIDDAQVASLAQPITLDPGHHTITGSARDAPPFRTSLTLPEGARLTLTVLLDPAAAPVTRVTRPPIEPVEQRDSRGAGYVALAAGGVLVAGAAVSWLVRHGDIADLNRGCANGLCPSSREDELTSERKRALVLGPLAAVLGAAGAVGIGIGIYLVTKPASASTAAPPAALRIAPTVSRDGAQLGVSGVF